MINASTSEYYFITPTSTHLMLVPSLNCPASCSYCFGPHEGQEIMSLDIIHDVISWQKNLGTDRLEITFHGGEPLLAGADFYKQAFPLLSEGLKHRSIRFGMQSNLWLLTDELCQILSKYRVSLGTSLDGPESITDAQRGTGYYQKTMAGIRLAQQYGIDMGCICTFTKESTARYEEIFSFFLNEELPFSIHAAVPSIKGIASEPWIVTPDSYGELLKNLLNLYLNHLDSIRIRSLDSLCRSVSAGHGGICTFSDCLGKYLAVGPDGFIYPCQRFCGMSEYRIGDVRDCPSMERLQQSTVWNQFSERQKKIDQECSECAHLKYCRGGCPYNSLVGGNGSLKDPYCDSYQAIYQYITDKALEEVFSDTNMEAVITHADESKGLLREGKLLSLMRRGSHPSEINQNARRIIAAYLLGKTNSPEKAAHEFCSLGLSKNLERTKSAFERMYHDLTGPVTGLNNLYLHVTFACNLQCTHCYADAQQDTDISYPIQNLVNISKDAVDLGFRHLVITGGEPLIHPQRIEMLDLLSSLRLEVKPLLTVLRTNLAMPLDDEILKKISFSTDEVVVSIDGDQATHDNRRGIGSYDLTVSNLRRLITIGGSTSISIATVLPAREIHGKPGKSVKKLANELGIKRIRFRPVLPLGRAQKLNITQEYIHENIDSKDIIGNGFSPAKSCGIGQNLYVKPDNRAFPCYAWQGEGLCLGSLAADGLNGIISSERFLDLSGYTVNTNEQCKECALRYICGGACRAWNWKSGLSAGLDAGPVNCEMLRMKAESLLKAAREYLKIEGENNGIF